MTNNANIILSKNIKVNNNTLCICGANSGVQYHFLEPNIKNTNSSLIIADPSGELYNEYADYLKNQGYDIKVFNSINLNKSNSYNPFEYMKTNEDVEKFANNYLKITNNKNYEFAEYDPFWEKSEVALFKSVIFYMKDNFTKEEQNFNTIINLLNFGKVDNRDEESELERLFKIEKEKNPKSIAVKQYNLYRETSKKNYMEIWISLTIRLSIFNIKEINKLTKIDTLDLQEIRNKKTALFIIISTSENILSYLARILYTQLLEILSQNVNNKINIPVHFIFNNFVPLGYIPNLNQYILNSVDKDISYSIIIQNIIEFKEIYRKSWNDIIKYCNNILFFGSHNKETCEYILEKFNNIIKTNKLLVYEDLIQLNNEDCIILLNNEKIIKDKKY